MNKILLSAICAAAVTSSASAFVLDLSSLSGQTLGLGTITNEYGTFQVLGPGSQAVDSSGSVTLNDNEALTIIYPDNVEYVGALIAGSAVANDQPGANSVQYTSNQNGASISSVTFNGDAVPEPSSTALLGLGGLALILRRRK